MSLRTAPGHTRLYGDEAVRSALTLKRLPQLLQDRARRADLSDENIAGLGVWLGTGVLLTVVAWFSMGTGSALLGASVVLLVPVGLLIAWSGRRDHHIVQSLPDAVDLVARSLRSGASLSQGLAEACASAPPSIATELALVVEDIRVGHTVRSALQAWVDASTLVEVRLVAAALSIAHDHPAGATRSLEGVGQTLRDRAALAKEITALTAQAAASMQALVVLPFAFLGLDLVTGRSALTYLVTEPLGRLCLIVGLGLDAAGWLWMRLIIRKRLST